jgi:hypothetical protein
MHQSYFFGYDYGPGARGHKKVTAKSAFCHYGIFAADYSPQPSGDQSSETRNRVARCVNRKDVVSFVPALVTQNAGHKTIGDKTKGEGETMKKTIIRTIAALSLFASLSAAAYAQTDGRATFKIPFNFTVNNQVFPAGDYTVQIQVNHNPQLLRIGDANARATAFVRTTAKISGASAKATKMIFRTHGDQYFLGEIWAEGENEGHELMRSRTERELLKAISKDHLALASATKPVTIAAQ